MKNDSQEINKTKKTNAERCREYYLRNKDKPDYKAKLKIKGVIYRTSSKGKKYIKNYRINNKEHQNELNQKYYLTHKDELLSKFRSWKIKNWQKWNEYNNEWCKKYKKENKHKVNAQQMALAYFDLPDKKCPICNKRKVQDRHHEDYSKPLEIIFVCKKCHKLLGDQKRARDYDDNLIERRVSR